MSQMLPEVQTLKVGKVTNQPDRLRILFWSKFLLKKVRVWVSLVLLFVVGSFSRATAGTYIFGENFESAVAPGWTFTGNASLTGGSSDPNGQGWLRLTNNGYSQSSFVFNSTDLPFLYGVDIKLSVAIWGGSGADGLAVNLINGSTNVITPGGYGGSLGYAQRSTPSPTPGLLGGILGIALDEYGNYSNSNEGRVGGPGFTPNAIAIRGPGDGTANAKSATGQNNYAYLTGAVVSNGLQTGANGTTTRPVNYYTAEFIINTQDVSQGTLPVSVLLTDKNGTQTIINNYDAYSALVNYYGGAQNLPTTMDIGFSAGTGAYNNYHEIRSLTINSIDNIPGYDPVPEPAEGALAATGIGLIVFGSIWRRKRKTTAEMK
jgi:hypothetical protein